MTNIKLNKEIEKMILREDKVIKCLENNFPDSVILAPPKDINLLRAYIDLKRSREYLVKYLEEQK